MTAPTLWCVDDDVPPETLSLLAAAAASQGVGWQVVRPGDPLPRPAAGDLLFRPAVSPAAMALERRLWRADLHTFWATTDGPWAVPAFPPTLLTRAGAAVPAWADLPSAAPAALDAAEAAVGPPPWVVKIPGHAGGHGVFQVDSRPALSSLTDYLLGEGQTPWLMAFAPGVHWRVVVVGDRAVAAYPNPVRPGDFRTQGTEDPRQVVDRVPAALAQAAITACSALGVRHGGVDLVVAPGRPPVVLETNFPCYFAHAEVLAGVPVAAAMVAWLRAAPPPAAPAASGPMDRPAGPVWLIDDEGAPYNAELLAEATVAAGRGLRRLAVTNGAPGPPPADAEILRAGWSVAAWRLASVLGAVPAHQPSLLALTEADAALPVRWRALWAGGAVLGWIPVADEAGEPPDVAALTQTVQVAAARARRPWLQVELAGPPRAPVAVGLYHPPDLASFPEPVARAAAAARVALTAWTPRPTVGGDDEEGWR
ncbi:MAG: hypothetical protein H6702_24620 [Myxococcales bacterium]|nr:hypothetical protein [Myxococcales bacterium]